MRELYGEVKQHQKDMPRHLGNLANHLNRAGERSLKDYCVTFARTVVDPRVRARIREIDAGFAECFVLHYGR